VPIVLKSGCRKLLEPSGPVKSCNGIALPFECIYPRICEQFHYEYYYKRYTIDGMLRVERNHKTGQDIITVLKTKYKKRTNENDTQIYKGYKAQINKTKPYAEQQKTK
jgi:hypothetical protein